MFSLPIIFSVAEQAGNGEITIGIYNLIPLVYTLLEHRSKTLSQHFSLPLRA